MMYPVKGHSMVLQQSSGDGVRGQGEVRGGGAVDELLVGWSKRAQAKGRKTTNKNVQFPHALARRSTYFQ
jgi:hypothetical protein